MVLDGWVIARNTCPISCHNLNHFFVVYNNFWRLIPMKMKFLLNIPNLKFIRSLIFQKLKKIILYLKNIFVERHKITFMVIITFAVSKFNDFKTKLSWSICIGVKPMNSKNKSKNMFFYVLHMSTNFFSWHAIFEH